MSTFFAPGLRVMAVNTITEGGFGYEPNEKAEFPEPNYIHAKPGEQGIVVHITDDGLPTVLFDRTGSSTIVSEVEITVVTAEEEE